MFTKILLLFSCLVLCCFSVYKEQNDSSHKNVLFYTFEYLLLCFNYYKINKRQIYNNRSERTLFCCLNVHLLSATRYITNIEENKRPKIKSSKVSEDS